MHIVHIGLPKSATTSLQRNLFSYLPSFIPDLVFNDSEIVRLCMKKHVLGLTEMETQQLSCKLNRSEKLLISIESLVNWNPRQWEVAADTNLSLFGENATILITLRNPIDYMTSVYQQVVQEGLIVRPEKFLRCGSECDLLERVLLRPVLDFFDVDAFSYPKLAELYERRFKRVVYLPISLLPEMNWLEPIFGLDSQEQVELSIKFKSSRPHNGSYSKLAMQLTFAREKLVNSIRLKTMSSHERSADFLVDYYSNGRMIAEKATHANVIAKARKKLVKAMRWRKLMQSIVNEYLPNTKFELPPNVLSVLPDQFENLDFVDQKERLWSSGVRI